MASQRIKHTVHIFFKKLQKTPDITPVRIATPTISYEELDLYGTALKQKNFDTYFAQLTPQRQRMLTIAAGQHARDEKN